MELEAAMEGWTPRRQRRNGCFWLRAEIEVEQASSIPRGPEFGFAAAVREPLVKLRRPEYDFERWDWDYFVWPHDRLDANLEMRDSDPEATLEADRNISERFLNQTTLQLESYEMYRHTAWPCNHLKTNLEMRDSDPETTLEADQKASESFLNQCTLQLENYEMDQHTPALPRDHLQANLETRSTNTEVTLQADLKTKERSMRKQKRPRMDRRTQEQHNEKENEGAELFSTPMPVNKKTVGPRSARRRRVFAEANRSLDDDRASHTRTHHLVAHMT